MKEFAGYFISTAIFAIYQITPIVSAESGIMQIFERVGIPLGFAVLFWVFFSRQLEKRHKEQREFWADNNKYLRELIDQFRKGSGCKYER